MDLLDMNAGFVLDDFNGWVVGAKETIARLIKSQRVFDS